MLYDEYNIIYETQSEIDYYFYIKNIFACEVILDSINIKSNYLLRQISNYNWIDVDVIKNSILALHKALIKDNNIGSFNVTLPNYITTDYAVTGTADYIINNVIYSYKYDDIITNEYIFAIAAAIALMNVDTINEGHIVLYPSGKCYTILISNKTEFMKIITSKNNLSLDKSLYEIIDNYLYLL